jgi:hypothetical protein
MRATYPIREVLQRPLWEVVFSSWNLKGPMVGSVNLAVMVKSVNVGESGDYGEFREGAARALILLILVNTSRD